MDEGREIQALMNADIMTVKEMAEYREASPPSSLPGLTSAVDVNI